jgi:hypothetical protein
MLWFCVVWLPFLPRQEIKKPAPDETPKWTECMSLYDGAAVAATYVYQRMLPLEYVPRWRLNQCPRENTHEACVSLGCIKQKSVDLKWWKAGVQQIILWAGTARTGRAAKGRYNAKQAEAQRQAVGRWQPQAKGMPKSVAGLRLYPASTVQVLEQPERQRPRNRSTCQGTAAIGPCLLVEFHRQWRCQGRRGMPRLRAHDRRRPRACSD